MNLREIDRLAAERVMGWPNGRNPIADLCVDCNGKPFAGADEPPTFTQDMRNACELLNHLYSQGWSYSITHEHGEPYASLRHVGDGTPNKTRVGYASAATMPLAITLAALDACRVPVQPEEASDAT